MSLLVRSAIFVVFLPCAVAAAALSPPIGGALSVPIAWSFQVAYRVAHRRWAFGL